MCESFSWSLYPVGDIAEVDHDVTHCSPSSSGEGAAALTPSSPPLPTIGAACAAAGSLKASTADFATWF